MNRLAQKEAIEESLKGFSSLSLEQASLKLFDVLGYRSEKRLILRPNNADTFLETFVHQRPFNKEQALLDDWETVNFLFQLTDTEIQSGGQGSLQFSSKGKFEGANIESYLFFAITLKKHRYTRTQLSAITRAVNRLFSMPVMLLFRHRDTITFSIIRRRIHKRDESKDVLEKVTLIKDIRFGSPHRAHIEILFDLSFDALYEQHRPANFVELHAAWQKTLNIQVLNKRFFLEIRNWFYWARLHARFPDGAQKDADGRDSEALIRLLTRMIFCWFLREKDLIPDGIFSERLVEHLLQDWQAKVCEKDIQGRYYKAILQNLFFTTLNTPVVERKFRSVRSFHGKNKHYGDQRYFRHIGLFIEKAPVEELYKSIPFLNGGLFENLDEFPGSNDPSVTKEKRVDGFSDVASKQPTVPDFLFFGEERAVPEVAALLGDSISPKARGLIHIFRDYKFTIEENTSVEEDVALDPELLGLAFENLLASVNPETGTIARKSTGSFYTPREIVNYMIEEVLVRHLYNSLNCATGSKGLEERLRELVSEEREFHRFGGVEADGIVDILSRLRILDPACGSGAFPMVLLQRVVHILRKLDPGNERWKAAKLTALPVEMREKAEEVFRLESFDYTRKLELIKDCIHGVDIQPTAIQISKLRFFLSLVIEQKDPHHIRPLPNLETKFICANTLLNPRRPEGWDLFLHKIEPKERSLLDVRARYFFALTRKEKDTCRFEDSRLRQELKDFIEALGRSSARLLASDVAAWDPYKTDSVAEYFDPESMFGVRDGFDITIGNPPYVRADEQSDWNRRQRQQIVASKQYETLWEKWDLFVPFIERSYKLLRPGGITSLIVSDAFCHSKYAQKAQNWYLKQARILRLDFCSDVKIFDAAVHNVIYFFQRADGAKSKPERRVHRETFGQVTLLPTDEQAKLTYRAFFPEDRAASTFSCTSIELGSVCYISVGMVVHADEKVAKGEFELDDVVVDRKDAKHPRRFVEGKHLERWLAREYRWLEWGTSRAPALFRRPTFPELYTVPEKIFIHRTAGEGLRSAYDVDETTCNHTIMVCLPWHSLHGVRNPSLKKSARYLGEKSPRPDLPKREELEATSRRFAVKYLLGVMNSASARDFLRANRRSNTDLYPDDWKKLPIPDVPNEKQAPIVALVEKILALLRENDHADMSALESEIDYQVAALYGLRAATGTGQSP
jgi:hypothetical protein